MNPFEVLYRKRCRVPINWDNPIDRLVLGPEMLKDMEQIVQHLKLNLKTDQDWQKSYAYKRRMHKEFKVKKHVYIKDKPKKSTLNLGSCAKLAPIFCGLFQVLARIGLVAYINLHYHPTLKFITSFVFYC